MSPNGDGGNEGCNGLQAFNRASQPYLINR